MATATRRKKRKRSAKPESSYSWRGGGANRFGVPVSDIVTEVARIAEENGGATPEAVVSEAAHPDSPLHGAFEWDDEKAAQSHRLWQARIMIRSVYVQSGPSKEPHPVFVHVKNEDGGGYQPVSLVITRPDMLAAAMDELQGKLSSASRSVSELRELAAAAGDIVRTRKAAVVGKHLDAATKAAK